MSLMCVIYGHDVIGKETLLLKKCNEIKCKSTRFAIPTVWSADANVLGQKISVQNRLW